jgi:hypothetical protein
VLRAGAVVALGLVVVVSVAAGVGLLYLLRAGGVLGIGPQVSGALPLQRLAGSDSQPLVRMAVAWLATGAVAGLELRGAGLHDRALRGAVAAVVAYVFLVATGAVSDAVTVSGNFGDHLGPQFGRPGTLVATAFMAAGAILAGRQPRPARGAR